jgi:hypothetical protein
MLLVLLALLLIIAIIVSLTGGFGRRTQEPVTTTDEETIGTVRGVAQRALNRADEGAGSRRGRAQFGGVLLEVMERLGVDRGVALRDLAQADLSPEADGAEATRHVSLAVHRGRAGWQQDVERALLVGIQVARTDDDYAGVGDEIADLETLAQRAEAAEIELFGGERRERYLLYGKAALVLQDMLQGERDGVRLDAIRRLLTVLDEEIRELQDELHRSMASVPPPGTLLWGDTRDRRLYYFKMGVTNSLRRSGSLESLGHLYRLSGVNYDVEEAYELAASECAPLALADRLGIERLIGMGPPDVQGLVNRSLPGG